MIYRHEGKRVPLEPTLALDSIHADSSDSRRGMIFRALPALLVWFSDRFRDRRVSQVAERRREGCISGRRSGVLYVYHARLSLSLFLDSRDIRPFSIARSLRGPCEFLATRNNRRNEYEAVRGAEGET